MDCKERLLHIADRAIRAVAADEAVHSALHLDGDELRVGGRRYDLAAYERIRLMGAGKASAAMAGAVMQVLNGRCTGGTVVTKYGHGLDVAGVEVMESAHPVPDLMGELSARRFLDMAGDASGSDLIFFLLSGGASALAPAPRTPVTLRDKMQATQLLLDCGAAIHEINAVRKHLSAFKGGQLAKAFEPADVVTLIISDVVGGDLDVIGSGPTAPDRSTFGDCLGIISKYSLEKIMPETVMKLLGKGAAGRVAETVRNGDSCFQAIQNVIVASNDMALDGAADAARELAYEPHVLRPELEGEARNTAEFLAGRVAEMALAGSRFCLLAGGETTVTIKGKGKGGRNQEMALALGIELEKRPEIAHRISLACVGTDGSDGPTDAAGGLILSETLDKARRLGLDPRTYLDDNDAYNFLDKVDALLKTGPTRTNVMDIVAVLVD